MRADEAPMVHKESLLFQISRCEAAKSGKVRQSGSTGADAPVSCQTHQCNVSACLGRSLSLVGPVAGSWAACKTVLALLHATFPPQLPCASGLRSCATTGTQVGHGA